MRLIFVSIVVVMSLISCSKDPISTGSKQIPGSDLISTKVFDSELANINQKTSNYAFMLKAGSASQIILGKNSYGESDVLMKFDLTVDTSISNHFTSSALIILSAWVTMDSTYSLGSPTAPFDFSAYKITQYNSGQYWNLGFDRDSVSLLTYDNTNQNTNLSPAVVDSTVMRFNISPNLAMSWLKAQYQVNNTTDKNLGMILKPTSGTNKYFGFDAISTPPQLHVAFQLPSLKLDTVTFSTNYILHFFTPTPNVASRPDEFYLEGSQSLRGTLFFNLPDSLKLSLFNKATLTLTYDSLSSFDGSPSSSAIDVQLLADSAARKLADSVTIFTLTRNGNQFSGDINGFVQKWIDGKVINQGLLLSLTDEMTSVARIAICNSTNQNKDLRPRLKLYYIKKNNTNTR